jgi:hypothetical protein
VKHKEHLGVNKRSQKFKVVEELEGVIPSLSNSCFKQPLEADTVRDNAISVGNQGRAIA